MHYSYAALSVLVAHIMIKNIAYLCVAAVKQHDNNCETSDGIVNVEECFAKLVLEICTHIGILLIYLRLLRLVDDLSASAVH